MYTIVYLWVSKIDSLYPESRGQVFGFYDTLEKAKIGLKEWIEKHPNILVGEMMKSTDEKYIFISEDWKTRGSIEIQKMLEF